MLAHAIGYHASFLGRGPHHPTARAHAEAVDIPPRLRVVHQLVFGWTKAGVSGLFTPARPIDEGLGMLNAKAYREGFAGNGNSLLLQPVKGVTRTVP
jgi:hypothetical protein